MVHPRPRTVYERPSRGAQQRGKFFRDESSLETMDGNERRPSIFSPIRYLNSFPSLLKKYTKDASTKWSHEMLEGSFEPSVSFEPRDPRCFNGAIRTLGIRDRNTVKVCHRIVARRYTTTI